MKRILGLFWLISWSLDLDGRIGEAAALQPLLAPLADLGAATITPHTIGASDHVSLEETGVPGFAFIRDFIETSGGTNHTNMDVYDRLLPADLERAAVVTATLVYELAQETEPFPRTDASRRSANRLVHVSTTNGFSVAIEVPRIPG